MEKLFQQLHYINRISKELPLCLTDKRSWMSLSGFYSFCLQPLKDVVVHLMTNTNKNKLHQCAMCETNQTDVLFRAGHPICSRLQDAERRRKWDTRPREWVFRPPESQICIYKTLNYAKDITSDLVRSSITATLQTTLSKGDRSVSVAVQNHHLCTESLFVYKPTPAWWQ